MLHTKDPGKAQKAQASQDEVTGYFIEVGDESLNWR